MKYANDFALDLCDDKFVVRIALDGFEGGVVAFWKWGGIGLAFGAKWIIGQELDDRGYVVARCSTEAI